MASIRVIPRKCLSAFYNVTRTYSVFPKHYVDPIYNPKMQEKIEKTEEATVLQFASFKPVFSPATSSDFYDDEIRLFTNYIMRKGKKVLARELVEKTFENIKCTQVTKYNKLQDIEAKSEIELDPRVIFHQAIENAKPVLELRSFWKGGITYKIPTPMPDTRRRFLAMNWYIQAAKEKEESTTQFHVKLARHLIDGFHNQGRVIRRKQELHRQCEANRAYAHFRW